MTPSARYAAAIELLDRIFSGEPAERVLTRWSRASRFAGSKDRAGVRDIVFDGLRQRRSFGWIGGADSGRGVVLGMLLAESVDPDTVFSGGGYAPEPLSLTERNQMGRPISAAEPADVLDYPDFLEPELQRSLGASKEAVLKAFQSRAPTDLRVNIMKADRNSARRSLAEDSIEAFPLDLSQTGLRITENARQLARSRAYLNGLVELQDVSSQAVADVAAAQPGMRVLDYCAGGGGKTLALAAQMGGRGVLMAHDINPNRMKDIPERAKRAGVQVEIRQHHALPGLEASFDLVLVDAPCSGVGAWRRNPDMKWRVTQSDIDGFAALQDEVLHKASAFVRPGGRLVYATCSVLRLENEDRTAHFLSGSAGFSMLQEGRLSPLDGGDGFYFAEMQKA